jgi:cytochrome P450
MTVMTDIFTSPRRFTDLRSWHVDADRLRADGPVHCIEQPGFRPFWAVVDHATVMEIERQPELFTNEPDTFLARSADLQAQRESGAAFRTLVQMDAPDHPLYRRLTADWFKPSSLGRLQSRLDTLCTQMIERLEKADGACDFAADVAVWYPLAVILAILGLPEDDYPLMLRLTQEFFGSSDAQVSTDRRPETVIAAMKEFHRYFLALAEQRNAHPTDDLATLIATGRINGEPLPRRELVSYFLVIATAGHDTTSSAISGGLLALLQNPDQLALLRSRPGLLNNAVDEMIRYTSPVRHFMRTSQADTSIAGTTIAKGDWIYLSYLAANRDPALFADPHRFDITRINADKHLAFGFGAHFCLGAQLARMEMRVLFGRLLAATDHIELAGDALEARSMVVGGTVSLPIRYRLR